MALNVQLNTRISTAILGTSNSNFSYYDPVTGVNLNKGNPISGDLSNFAPAQLVNIANAIYYGTISVVPASSAQAATAMPTHTATSALYNTYFYKGSASGSFVPNSSGGEVPSGVKLGQGITGVAAADLLENNF